jgi:hypothetical protein
MKVVRKMCTGEREKQNRKSVQMLMCSRRRRMRRRRRRMRRRRRRIELTLLHLQI